MHPKITVSADTETAVKVLEVTVSVTSGAEGFYSTDLITWTKIEDTLYLTENGEYYFKAINPTNGLESSTYTTLDVNNIYNVAPTLDISCNIYRPTNQDVTLTATASSGTVEYYNGSEWVAGSTLTVSENGTYLFRATDAAGNVTEKSIVVRNIDRVAPTLEINGNVTEWTNQDITLTANASDGTLEYFDGSEWVAGSILTVTENGTYQFRVTDDAGNVTEKSIVVDKIDKTAPVLNISHVLEGNDVKIFAASNEGTVEYYNGSTWVVGNTLTVTENGTHQFRVSDAAGNVTAKKVIVVTESFTNADRLNSGDILIVKPGVFVNNMPMSIPADSSVTLCEGAVLLRPTRAEAGVKINGFLLNQSQTVSSLTSSSSQYLLRLNDVLVNAGETGTLYAGQRANNVQVLSGGNIVVHDNAFLAIATIEAGASLVLHSGAVVNSQGNTICSGASATIEGGVIFHSRMNIEAGAKINGFLTTNSSYAYTSTNSFFRLGTVSVAAGETGTVYAGQQISNVQVAEGGSLVIKNGGQVETISFAGNNSLTIESGGTLKGSTSLSGNITIYDGARFDDITVSSGSKVNGFTVNSDTDFTSSILSIENAAISAGDTGTVYAGQQITNVQMAEGSSLVIKNGGTVQAQSDFFSADSSLTIESGGMLKGNVTFRNGNITIHDGALFDSITVYYGNGGSKVNGFDVFYTSPSGSAERVYTNVINIDGAHVHTGDTGTVYAGQTIEYVQVAKGGSLVIKNGGTVERGSFTADSSLTIESGGMLKSGAITCRNITIHDGALFDCIEVYSGCKFNGFTIRSHFQTFYNGIVNIVGDAVVNAGDTGTVYAGQTIDSVLMEEGASLVLRGGAAVGNIEVVSGASITIESGASFSKLNVCAGATVNGIEIQETCTFYNSILTALYTQTEISSGKTLTLGTGQTAANVDISKGGSLIMQNGAHAGHINVDRGAITVHAGAQFDSITTAGFAEINGFAVSNTTLNNSTVSISSVIVDATRTGTLYAGQKAETVMITGGGHVIVHDQATANNVHLYEGGAITVHAGAQFDNITAAGTHAINGFTILANPSATFSYSTISIGEALVNTGDTGTLYAGQSANDITVYSNGKMEVMEGAQVTNSTVYGTITVYDNALFNSLRLAAGAKFNGFSFSSDWTLGNNKIDNATVHAGDTGTVYAGQTVTSATVSNGAHMVVRAGGTAERVNLQQGGTLLLQGTLDLTGTSGITLQGSSQVQIEVDGGKIKLALPNSTRLAGRKIAGITDETISVAVDSADLGEYVILAGYTGSFDTITITNEGSVLGQITVDGSNVTNDTLGYSLVNNSGNLTIVIKDIMPPAAPTITAVSSTTLTNQDVIISLSVDEKAVSSEYSLDGKTWYSFNDTVTAVDNGTYYFRSIDADGDVSEITTYEVTNIDKVAPTLEITGNVTEWTNQDVTLTANASDGTVEYFNGSDWVAGEELIVTENGTYLFRVTDAAGNVTEQSIIVDKIDKTAPDAPVATSNIREMTNGSVIVSAEFSIDTVKKEYSFDEKAWFTYTGEINFEENGIVYFRGTDRAGNISKTTIYEVANIDKIAPEMPLAFADITDPTNGNVHVDANFSDDTVTREYSFNGKDWFAFTAPVVFENNGVIYFRGTDAAGNVSKTAAYEVANIDKVAPTLEITGNVTEWTHQDITLIATASDGTVEYFNGSEWVAGDRLVVSENGTYLFRATDAVGNITEQSVLVNKIDKIIVPQNLQSSADGVSWDGTRYADSYQVQLDVKGTGGTVSFETTGTQVDFYSSAENTFNWQVAADNGEWVSGDEIVISGTTEPQKHTSVENSHMDLLIANANGIWDDECVALHVGITNGWQGTNEFAVLNGKNIIADVFEGSSDANILLLTDDANGDALFVDDVYTVFPGTVIEQQTRIARIDEIRAGAGDDIIDMASQRFAYIGDGVKVSGGLGDDTIWANNGNNILFGDAGNDRLVGGGDNDVIVGGTGNDSMHGGGGNDTFCFGGNWGNDTIEQLEGGSVTLHFENGSSSNWNAGTLTYTDGSNSVTVQGTTDITLIFGGTAPVDGAFADAVSEKIFEDRNNGVLA